MSNRDLLKNYQISKRTEHTKESFSRSPLRNGIRLRSGPQTYSNFLAVDMQTQEDVKVSNLEARKAQVSTSDVFVVLNFI